MSLARRSMILRGLIPDVHAICKVNQLSGKLKKIVDGNMTYYEGQDPQT